jgi:type II secretory ATPase GspE/PulE/Tfp pilus assembly ATPase PilB-like protein
MSIQTLVSQEAPSPKGATSALLHYSNFKDLPAYTSLLTHGLSAAITLAENKQRHLAALGKNGGFILLSTPEERLSVTWYHVVTTLKAKGYKFKGQATVTPEIINLLLYDQDNQDSEASKQTDQDAQVVQNILADSVPIEWFKNTLHACMQLNASDLHFELRGSTAKLRVRLDGIMRVMTAVPLRIALDGISACYNLVAQEGSRSEVAFNIGVAQVAMIPLLIHGEQITLRFQSHPAVDGLDVILRILRGTRADQAELLKLERLGYTDSQTKLLMEAVGTAWGGIFVAGVTGSGKTTTLNTLLTQLARPGNRKIISIEDPVEYQVEGVSHLSVQRQGTDDRSNPFLVAMMAFLRMDPDVGMFGEIRDAVSAEMAMAAIQTGHKILTTVHATSAVGVIGRLTSKALGLNRESICNPEFLSALVYQVLTPLNCPHCKVPAASVMTPASLQTYQDIFALDTRQFFCASDKGCSHCRKPGIDYKNSERVGVRGVKVHAEVLVPDLELLLLLSQGKDIEARRVWRNRRNTAFDNPEMHGKEAWGHALYDMSQGLVDPYYFELNFGSPNVFTTMTASSSMPALPQPAGLVTPSGPATVLALP